MNRKVNQSGDQYTPGQIILGSNPNLGNRWEGSTVQKNGSRAYNPPYRKRTERSENVSKLKERDKRVEKEQKRLLKLFKDIPENKKKAVQGLIIQASRLRVLLDEMWADISENGDYEMFSQSERQEPYERERPVAKLYNSRDVSYQRVIKQLTDLMPEMPANDLPDNSAHSDGSDLLC